MNENEFLTAPPAGHKLTPFESYQLETRGNFYLESPINEGIINADQQTGVYNPGAAHYAMLENLHANNF